jgi:hypothetical protein
MEQQKPKPKVDVIKPDLKLQLKVGTGELDQRTLDKCKVAMETSQKKVDFVPLALVLLEALKTTIIQLRDHNLEKDIATRQMTSTVMQLKANASTFGYPLVGNLAAIMLDFLESLTEVDNNAIAIVEAHHVTLGALVKSRMSGDGGPQGKALETELMSAIQRYNNARSKA